MRRSRNIGLAATLACVLGACTGAVTDDTGKKPGDPGAPGSGNGPGDGSSGNGSGGPGTVGGAGVPNIVPGDVTAPPEPFEATTAFTAVRKVKNLLTGLAPTDQEVAAVTATGAAGLQALINSWMTQPDYQDKFKEKMLFLFRNTFQQTGFTPTEDFKPQLLTNGGFDFGNTAPGDDAFSRLVQNLEDSFALTAWGLVAEGRPFTEVLTTRRYMMTTGLKSLYLQIEMAREQRNATTPVLAFRVDESGVDIPLEQVLDPASANYMTFADAAPLNVNANRVPPCRGTAGMINPYTGYSQVFQVLLGFIPRYQATQGVTTCQQHASKPYFTAEDMSDWQWVTTRDLATGEAQIPSYDLFTLRRTTELALHLPRVGFYTTPAFLALWNTNDSNQHRVTANQTLLVALGQSFTSESTIIPVSAPGLDAAHAVDGSECYACHKSLDPLRQFWASQFDFNDRNEFLTRGVMGGAPNPRPPTTGGVLAFADVNAPGGNIYDLGPMLAQITDMAPQPIQRFAIAITQQLCFFANSSPCTEEDPEFRRIALVFQTGNYNFPSLIKEFFSSALVTGAKTTLTFETIGQTISIARRDQLCQALSNRLAKPDLCAITAPLPTQAQSATLKIATSVPADAFSRGSENPVTSPDPTMFYRAATEMLCENIAPLVVDAAAGTIWVSTDPTTAIAEMTQKVIGYPPTDPHYTQAVAILTDHFTQAQAQAPTTGGGRGGGAATTRVTNALRSTFVAACESPTSLSFGL